MANHGWRRVTSTLVGRPRRALETRPPSLRAVPTTHRSTASCLLALALLSPACGPGGGRTESYDESRPRSLVLIVVDTLRGDRVHAGPDALRMAAARRLAEDGVPFSRTFSHASMTLPSHTALLSGLHPYDTGVLSNGDPVPEGLELLPDRLLARDYQTTAIASIRAISSQTVLRAFEHVVDVSEGGLASAEESLQHMQEALDRLEPERPFFLLAHFADPHAPYRAHEDLAARTRTWARSPR